MSGRKPSAAIEVVRALAPSFAAVTAGAGNPAPLLELEAFRIETRGADEPRAKVTGRRLAAA
jgi:hypothetical protein